MGKDIEKIQGIAYKLLQTQGDGIYSWDGKMYRSDIIRACIRPKVYAVGKLNAKHIPPDGEEEYLWLKMLLMEPNPLISFQMLLEKATIQLSLNNNAFILIVRDKFGMPCQLYNIIADGVETIFRGNTPYYKFNLINGETPEINATDVIHLRSDFGNSDLYGETPAQALKSIMECINTLDRGLVRAVKNGASVNWLMKFLQNTKPEDMLEQVENFKEMSLNIDSTGSGVAFTDTRAELHQIKPNDYVPSATYADKLMKRLYSFFNTNEKIINASCTEDEWNAYYEGVIEPLALQLANEFSRKLLSREERARGHSICFDASNLQFAHYKTKLDLWQMVDRGALTPNEWRQIMHYPPIPGGDEAIRRLDTATVQNELTDDE